MGRRAAAGAATRIQASFRGYNVRRRTPLAHLRVIRNVGHKLNELQARAADPVYMDKICADVMERRKLMEEAMSILLQLDGIQGVHPSVRDIRKSVNREVVQFMELMDVVIMGADSEVAAGRGRNRTSLEVETPTMSSGTFESVDRSLFPIPGASTLTSDNSSVDNAFYDRRETQSTSTSSRALDSGEPVEMDEHLGAGKTTEEQRHRAQRRQHSSSNGRFKDYPESGSISASSRAESLGQESSDYHDLEADAVWVETPSETASAVVVQSTFRGYRVRRTNPLKHLRVISEVRSKLRELCIQVSEPGFSSKLRSDGMERLKLSECITSLLLRLDSVQGVGEVVRDIRKSVTKEVFKLQDFVDSIISNPDSKDHKKESVPPLLSNMVEQEIEQFMEDSTDATTIEQFMEDSTGGTTPGATMKNSPEHGPGVTSVLGNDAVEKLSLSERDLESDSQSFLDHYDGSLPRMTGSTSDQKMGKDSEQSDHSEPDQSAVCDISSTEPDADQIEIQNSAVSFASIQAVDVHESAWSDHNPQGGEVTHVLEEERPYCSYCNVTELEGIPDSLMVDPSISHYENPSVLFVGSQDNVQLMGEPSFEQQQPNSDIFEQRINVRRATEESLAYNHPSSPPVDSLMNEFIALKGDLHSLQRMNPSIYAGEASTCNETSIQQLQSNHLAELDLIAHKYNFVPEMPPDLVASVKSLSTNNVSIKVENDLPSDMEVEGGNDTGISTPLDYVQEPLGVEISAAPSYQDTADQEVRHAIRVDDLIEENARLRTLLNEVLIFAELQSAQTAKALERMDRLEVQVALHKKSAEIWRKRSSLARRKK